MAGGVAAEARRVDVERRGESGRMGKERLRKVAREKPEPRRKRKKKLKLTIPLPAERAHLYPISQPSSIDTFAVIDVTRGKS